jgi:antibiotic biosynthesis monooxygenase (ABM) superfamily enzyme
MIHPDPTPESPGYHSDPRTWMLIATALLGVVIAFFVIPRLH